jgi:selenocysteine lyase/cysteine desulfurase
MHGSNVLGSVQDIKPVAEYLHANDIFFIVDGAHSLSDFVIRFFLYIERVSTGAFYNRLP